MDMGVKDLFRADTTEKRCRCCGQIIPPDIVFHGPVLQRVYNELRRAPRTAEQLRELVYGYREISYSAIYVEIRVLNRKLKPYGLRVYSPWRNAAYRLEA